MYNLLVEAWLPLRLRSGEVRLCRPAEIVAGLGGEGEPIAPAWQRADFDIATYEFLIGLLFAACPPRSQRDWSGRYDSPPSVDALDAAFSPLRSAFTLDGEKQRFLQDFEAFESGETVPIERLLIDAAGGNAVKQNKDLFQHRGGVTSFDLGTAAMALYAMQQFAPSGGAGHRTSMRGGGPLCVLPIPPNPIAAEEMPSLWAQVWASVPVGEALTAPDPRAFPWMAPTRVSNDKGSELFPEDGHPVQAFFGMPRRIRLEIADGEVRGFHTLPWGINYAGWTHPLTPYYAQKEGSEWLPRHPKPGRMGYRDWVSATAPDPESTTARPAPSVAAFRDRIADVATSDARARTLMAGWAMNNMEAEEFLFAVEPLYLAADPQRQSAHDTLARGMAEAGDAAWQALRRALVDAVLPGGAKADDKSGFLAAARARFFDETEPEFHSILADAIASPADEAHKLAGLKALARMALSQFDDAALPLLDDVEHGGERLARARGVLRAVLDGRVKKAPLHGALDLPAPGPKAKPEPETSR
ncbi:MAG: type I-E CRISPR-associated protein Cse1/CasA [Neomegalonema sp.]|nr:type I-E CRISPR-associated protein Cse1/CasA [Neomegalonema sp.]